MNTRSRAALYCTDCFTYVQRTANCGIQIQNLARAETNNIHSHLANQLWPKPKYNPVAAGQIWYLKAHMLVYSYHWMNSRMYVIRTCWAHLTFVWWTFFTFSTWRFPPTIRYSVSVACIPNASYICSHSGRGLQALSRAHVMVDG